MFVTDGGAVFNLPLDSLPEGASEGDVYDAEERDGTLFITGKNDEEKSNRQKRINALFEKLKRKRRNDKNEN